MVSFDQICKRSIAGIVKKALEAPPHEPLASWAAKHVRFPPGAPIEGFFDIKYTPYLEPILEDIHPLSPVEVIIFSKPIQSGGTLCGDIKKFYIIFNGLNIESKTIFPDQKLYKRYVEKKLRKAIKNIPSVYEKIKDYRKKEQKLERLYYPGGSMDFGNAGSESEVRMDSIQDLTLDEVSAFPIDNGQGDPVAQAKGRMTTYENRSKLYAVSSPGDKSVCRITKMLNEPDICIFKYFTPCPSCDKYQQLKFERLKWKFDKQKKLLSDIHFVCEHCKYKITEDEKKHFLPKSKFMNVSGFEPRNKKGYDGEYLAFSASTSMISWKTIITEFLEAKDDPSRLRVWVKERLAQAWDDEGEKISKNNIKKRVSDYKYDPLPSGVGFITAGVDFNESFTAIEIVGWGKDLQSWGLGYYHIEKKMTDPELWTELDRYLDMRFTHTNKRKLIISYAGLDTGYGADMVCSYIRSRKSKQTKMVALKGESGYNNPIISTRPSHYKADNAPFFKVSNTTSCQTLYDFLNVPKPGPGYCNFPRFYKKSTRPAQDGRYSYFDEIRGMVKKVKTTKARQISHWEHDTKIVPRVEGNDCRRYAMAVLWHSVVLGVDLNKLCDRLDAMEPLN